MSKRSVIVLFLSQAATSMAYAELPDTTAVELSRL